MYDIVYAAKGAFGHISAPPANDCWRFFYCTGEGGPYPAGSMLVLPPESQPLPTLAEAQGILLHLMQIPLVFRQPYLLEDDANQSILHLMQDALWHFDAAAPGSGPLLSIYGQLLVQHVSLRRPPAPQSQLVEYLARSITQNYADPNYELDALLKSAPYCYDYLCRLFRQEMHTTPHKYLMNLRLQSAADILQAGTSGSITEIARMCGYHDPLYFSRMFKKKFGLSPREYAKDAR